jgi:hypothetical protein
MSPQEGIEMSEVFAAQDGAFGRVEAGPGDPLYDALRPSRAAIEAIDRLNRENALACHAMRNLLIGSS